ncbi:hypothetical protein PIB30_060247 [Stylosanthes scabra]|uniref:Serine/threonine-protein phosphatase 7 long form-like n=1 Tax=Stylosanthes scabra TaxID=79078 RepID=A0ABU6ZJ55_9FABA|nr:hypothetical protein [Stylosanthes scabra]
MRQFGLDQPIPGRPHQPDELHSVTLSGRTDEKWPVIHETHIQRWDTRKERIQQGRPLVVPLTATSSYMKWYMDITRRWIGRSSSTLGRVVDLVEQLHISSSAPPDGFTFDSVRHVTTDILELLGEHDRTQLHQLSQPAPPTQTFVEPPPDEAEQGGNRARRRRTGLAATRTRLRDDEPSSSSSQATPSSTSAQSIPPPPPPQIPYQYPGYVVYPIPPSHIGAAGTSTASTTMPPPPFPFPYPYPYPPYQFPPPPPPPQS